MAKFHTINLFSIFAIIIILSSCDTLRKGSATRDKRQSSVRTGSSRNSPRNTAGRAPVKKNTPTNRSTANTTPQYTRPNGSYSKNIPRVVEIARTYYGTPYRSGGNDKGGIDCSGLICQVYSEMGVKVPRISWQQSEFGTEVSNIGEIKEGDWIFFVPEAGKEGYVSHAGIVTDVRGSNEIMFIHASTSKGVREDNLFSNYFKGRFVKAMRPF